MEVSFTTERLLLNPLKLADADFIQKLVNTPQWISFIGNRNVTTREAALGYIQNIINNPTIRYWVVKLKKGEVPIGVVTFIKREHLAHPDIGFAFLPAYTQKGYAYEAAAVVMDYLKQEGSCSHILATTFKDNISSIKLLEKLGLQYTGEINKEGESLLLYSLAVDQ